MCPTSISTMLDDILYFRNLFNTSGGFTPIPKSADVQYPVEVKYNDDHMVFEYYVAGIPKDEISVEVDGDHLIITHTKSKSKEPDPYTYLFSGVTKKDFRHVWKVNSMFDMDNVEVIHNNGVLSIIIPRMPEKKKSIKAIKF